MKNNKPILMLIISILSFLVTLAVFVLFIRIIINKNVHTSAVLGTLKSRMIDKENFSALEDKIKDVEVTHSKIDSYFILKNKADLFVDYIESLGKSSGTELTVTNIESQKENKDLILFKVSVIGNFNDVMKTISILENAPYSISINSVYINKEIIKENPDTKAPKVVNITPSWVADITFDVLTGI
jgi:hypothetical protein